MKRVTLLKPIQMKLRENERQNETQQRLTTQGTQRYHEDIMNGTDREHTHNTDDTGVDR